LLDNDVNHKNIIYLLLLLLFVIICNICIGISVLHVYYVCMYVWRVYVYYVWIMYIFLLNLFSLPALFKKILSICSTQRNRLLWYLHRLTVYKVRTGFCFVYYFVIKTFFEKITFFFLTPQPAETVGQTLRDNLFP